jgi:predicted NBD/HSP70 family sugar kinase
MRRHNLALVLSLLVERRQLSRADIAAITGLTRATASSLVGELIQRGLVREIGTGSTVKVGRPATLVELDGSPWVTLGVSIDVGYLSVIACDLAGKVVYERRSESATTTGPVHRTVDMMASEIKRAVATAELDTRTVVGATIAVPGITDTASGIALVTPNLGWRNVPLVELLHARIGTDFPLAIDNEANLAALAEVRSGPHAGVRNLVYVHSVIGVGGGAVVDGRLIRGASGAATEFGHMCLQPRGRSCSCGNRGCWETLIGLRALLRATVADIASDLVDDRSLGPDEKVAIVLDRAKANDPSTIAGLEQMGTWVGIGIANLIGVFNPEVVTLGGWLPRVMPWMSRTIDEAVRRHSLRESHCRIEPSALGLGSAQLGAAIHAGQQIFEDPTLVERRPEP